MKSWLHTLQSALAGAMAAATAGAVWESVRLAAVDAPSLEAILVSLGAYAVVALGATILATFVVYFANRTFDRSGSPGPIGLAVAMATLIASGLATWGAATYVSDWSGGLRAIVLGVAGSLLVGIALFLTWLAARRDSDTTTPTRIVDAMIVAGLLLTGALALLNPDAVMEAQPERLIPAAACLISALVSANHLPWRGMRIAGLVLTVPFGIGLASLLLTPLSNEARLAIEHQGVIVRAVIDTPRSENGSGARQSSEGSATCTPGRPAPALDAITDVGADAPDIILLTVDSLRWDHTSLADYERRTTPGLERHAPDAAVFSRAYSPAASTRQTFRALFTGLHPTLVAPPSGPRWALALPDGQETIASYLAAAGYHTAAVMTAKKTLTTGKNALHGFETVDMSPRVWWDDRGYSAPLMVDRIIAHLSEAGDDRPKFAWAHVMEPHQKYHRGPDPIDFGKSAMGRYDAAIHFVDGEVARLIEFVRGAARRRNTWLIITADHGHAFGEHGNRFHGHSVYEEEIHVPLIVFGPDVEPRRVDTPTGILDVVPTILDAAGIEPFESLCGSSLGEALIGNGEVRSNPVFVEQLPDASTDTFHVAWIEKDWKLLLRPGDGIDELYDLAADPDEQDNLAASNPEEVDRLKAALASYLAGRGIDTKYYGLPPTAE